MVQSIQLEVCDVQIGQHDVQNCWVDSRTIDVRASLWTRWNYLWDRLGLIDQPGMFEDLLQRWSGPGRCAENEVRLLESLALCDLLLPYVQDEFDACLIEYSLWYHRSFYSVQSAQGAQESLRCSQLSAQLAVCCWLECAGCLEQVQTIEALIRCTTHLVPVSSLECALMVDTDLAIWASPPWRLKSYLNERAQGQGSQAFHALTVSQESAFQAAWRAQITSHLQRQQIFRTPVFHDLLEPLARRRMRHYLDLGNAGELQ